MARRRQELVSTLWVFLAIATWCQIRIELGDYFQMHNRNLHTTKPRDIGWLNLYVRVINGPSQPNQKHLWDFRHSPLCLLNCRVTCKALHTQDINKSLLAFSTRLFWFQPDLTSPCLTSVTCCCSCCAQDSRYRWAFRNLFTISLDGLFHNFTWPVGGCAGTP